VRAQPHRAQRGTITIEFALVFPILVAVMFGFIDVGRFIATRTTLAQASAVAGRAACLSSTASTADITQAANDAAPMLNGMTASMTCSGACPAFPIPAGTILRVTVTYSFTASFYPAFTRSMTNSALITC